MSTETKLHYKIQPYRPEAHLYRIVLTIDEPSQEGQVVSLPAWIPGSYMIRDFARNIVSLRATNSGKELNVSKLDKQTWRCEPCSGELQVECEVYAWDLSVRSAHLDTTHAYFNGTSVFLMVHGREWDPCSVEILPPDGDAYQDWRVATAMTSAGAPLHGFGFYRAENYDELVDHPVEIGSFSLQTFDVAGVPHDMVITGRHDADMDRLCADVKSLCEHHVALYGELPPMNRYVFQVMAVGEGYGGLEHRASTSLLCSRYDLPLKGDARIGERYRNFLGLCSHEYFHTWNVKRIKPAVFSPYQLDNEVYTRLLWMFEGITSYYDDLSLVRTGLVQAKEYLEVLGQMVTRVIRTPGRFRQSVAESSFDAWTRFYKQDENSPNAIVSYYAKGALIALALDLFIRDETTGKLSLDDVMRQLWICYGKPGRGVDEKAIEDEIAQWVGLDLRSFFDRYLYGTEDLPLDTLLERFGVRFRLRPAESIRDKGGKQAADITKLDRRVSLGALIAGNGAGVKITHVLEGGAAQRSGLSAGDVIIALNGIQVSESAFEERLLRYQQGDTICLHVFRRDELMVFEVELQAAARDTCELAIIDDVKLRQWLPACP